MLVLSRKLGEKIFIGDDITITVTLIDRDRVRLGIDAPRDVPIYRQELATPTGGHVAPDRSVCRDSGVRVAPPPGCSVCHDPWCQNPGGKH